MSEFNLHSKKRKINDIISDDFPYDNISSLHMKSKKAYEIYSPYIYSIGKEIHFSSPVEKITIEILTKTMSEIIDKFYKDHDEDEELTLTYIVDSQGGDVSAALKFVDYLDLTRQKYTHVKFVSVISGTAASAATTMSVVADKRYMTKNATGMIHELSGGIYGRYTQMISRTEHIKDTHKKIVNIYLPRCNVDKKKLNVLLRKDKWFNADQYLEYGFIDEIK